MASPPFRRILARAGRALGPAAGVGATVGAFQFLRLEGRMSRSGWWVAASALGGVVPGPFAGGILWGWQGPAHIPWGPLAGAINPGAGALFGAAYGVVTGPVLAHLLRARDAGEPAETAMARENHGAHRQG